VMYMDRTCIGVAAPTLMREFEIDKIQMSRAASAFNVAYTFSGPSRMDGRPIRAALDSGRGGRLVVCLHSRDRTGLWLSLF